MRATTLIAFFCLGLAVLVLAPATTHGQGWAKKKGGGGNPGESFDRRANGRPSIPITELQFGKTEALQYAQEKGISNGMLNRQQYIEVLERVKAKFAGGFGKSMTFDKKSFSRDGGASLIPSVSIVPAPPNGQPAAPVSSDVLNQLADASFKANDTNGDGKLIPEEMPGPLRGNLAKWDKNGDGLIDMIEFRAYFASRLGGGGGGGETKSRDIVTIVIEEEELDRKPVVFRAGGKMPAGLPAWFKDLDKDEDGQVALYEWRRGGKDLDEFKEWDLNDDGFITPEEALRYLGNTKTASRSPGSSTSSSSNERPQMTEPGRGNRPVFDFGKFGKDKKRSNP